MRHLYLSRVRMLSYILDPTSIWSLTLVIIRKKFDHCRILNKKIERIWNTIKNVINSYFLWSYKIGLLRLPHPIHLSESIQPVKLPQNCDELAEGEAVDALGLGLYDSPSQPWFSGDLRKGSLKTVDCDSSEALKNYTTYTQSLICATSTRYEMASGDSGILSQTAANLFPKQSNFKFSFSGDKF